MKNDLRISYPLWMIWFIILIVSSVYLVGTTAVFQSNGRNEFSFVLNMEPKLVLFIILFLLLLISLIAFFSRIVKHNRIHPNKKFSFFYLTPPEYLDDDELFQLATGKATRKVYTFFASAIPILAIVYTLMPIGKMWMIIGIWFLGAMQYLIYYFEIRKYVK